MLAHPCSQYDANEVARLHDLFSGPMGVMTLACIGVGGLVAGARLVTRDRLHGALTAIGPLALGVLITWGCTSLGATTAECRSEGSLGWGDNELTWTVSRAGVPAFVVSTSTEGDSSPTRHISPVSAVADALFWAGLVATLAAWVASTRTRPDNPSRAL